MLFLWHSAQVVSRQSRDPPEGWPQHLSPRVPLYDPPKCLIGQDTWELHGRLPCSDKNTMWGWWQWQKLSGAGMLLPTESLQSCCRKRMGPEHCVEIVGSLITRHALVMRRVGSGTQHTGIVAPHCAEDSPYSWKGNFEPEKDCNKVRQWNFSALTMVTVKRLMMWCYHLFISCYLQNSTSHGEGTVSSAKFQSLESRWGQPLVLPSSL